MLRMGDEVEAGRDRTVSETGLLLFITGVIAKPDLQPLPSM
jgi:hypothetical protein